MAEINNEYASARPVTAGNVCGRAAYNEKKAERRG